MTHKKYKDMLHRRIIDRMMEHFEKERDRMRVDLNIKLGFAWKLKKRRKLIRAAKKKAKAESDKNKRFGGSKRKSTAVKPSAVTAVDRKSVV